MNEQVLNEQILRSRLEKIPIGGIRYFDVTGSTNDDALSWIAEGAEVGSLVIAEEQTAGRGRMQREWVTRKGTSLAFSLIFKPNSDEYIPMYAPLGALAVSLSLEELYSLKPQIKWPNDVLLGRKKVCGILTEASWHESSLQGVVLGIGINIASSAIREEDEFLFPAGTLQSNLDTNVDRIELLASILTNIFQWRDLLNSPKFVREWDERLAFRGEKVKIQLPGKIGVIGRVLRVSKDGLLVVKQNDGIELSISAGDVSLRMDNP